MPDANEPLLAALGEALVDLETRQGLALVAAIEGLAEQFDTELENRLAELPRAKDGEPGLDGTDRVLTLPRYIGPNDSFDRNDIAACKGGIWQAIRKGRGDPDTDPSAWRCLVPGVIAIEARDDWAKRERVFGFRMSDGNLNETRSRMLPGLLPPDYLQQGIGVICGDLVRDGDFERTALVDGADPTNVQDWQVREIRGRRGRDGKGQPGDQGNPGPGLTGLTLSRDQVSGRLAIVPAYADPTVKSDPILVDVLVDDLAPARRAIVGFAGKHDKSKAFGRGDVVAAPGPALWLSLKPDNRSPLVEGAAWERMV